MLRVVLDTNVVGSASLKAGGPPSQIVELVFSGEIAVCLSQAVLSEYQLVMHRPKFERNRPAMLQIVEFIAAGAEWFEPAEPVNDSPDPNDNRIVECAVAANAGFIVTGNRRHFPAFVGGTRVVTPREFLELLK